MKRSLLTFRNQGLIVPFLPLLLLTPFPTMAQGTKTWTNTSVAAPHLWSQSANWADGNAPEALESAEIFIDSFNRSPVAERTIQLDRPEQVLRGGLRFQFTGWSNLSTRIDLNGGRMTLDGGGLYFNGSMSAVTTRPTVSFTNGTLQLGTAENSSVLEVGKMIAGFGSMADTALVFGSGATFDSRNLAAIRIISEPVSYAQQFTLDLSQATVATGSTAGVLTTGTLEAAVYTATAITAGRSREATLRLGTMERLEVTGDLQLGVSAVTTTNAATTFSGTLLFTDTQAGPLEVNIGRSLKVGVGIGGKGSLRDLPGQSAIRVGRAEMQTHERGVLQIGFSHLTPTLASRAAAEGEVISEGGSFSAYISELRIGENRSSVGKGAALGTLDLGKATLSTLSVTGDAVLGSGHEAQGRLLLRGGVASSASLSIGNATLEAEGRAGRSLLRLDGTKWEVAGNFTLGAQGDVEIIVGNHAAGLDFATTTFSIASGGKITLTFNEAAQEGTLWGLRFLGDQSALLTSYQSAITTDGDYGNLATIFYDGSYTYYGLQQVPEPGSVVLLLLGSIAFIYRYGKAPRSTPC